MTKTWKFETKPSIGDDLGIGGHCLIPFLVIGNLVIHEIPVIRRLNLIGPAGGLRLPSGKYGGIITIYWGKVKKNLFWLFRLIDR